MVLVFCAKAHAAVFTAARKTPSTVLFSRDLHVLLLPKSVDPPVVYSPAAWDELLVNTLRSKTCHVWAKARISRIGRNSASDRYE